jgi:hypothetical protein
VAYRKFDTDKIPAGYTTVPVLLNDNGIQYNTVMVAGSVGYKVTSSIDAVVDAPNKTPRTLDTIQPVSGWWMYESNGKSESAGKDEDEDNNYEYDWDQHVLS